MAALFALPGCGAGSRASTYRFLLTVELDTPAGVRRGSSVIEIMARNTAALAPDGKARTWRVTGEAVAIDVPDGRTLFALLKTGAIHQDMAGLSMTALDPAFRNDVVQSAARIVDRAGIVSPAPVRPRDYPILVTFRDPADRRTMDPVEPDQLEAAFGPGVRLLRVTAALTEDPVTTGLDRRLPWLGRHPEPSVIPKVDHYDHSIPATLTVGDFIQRARG